MMYDALGNMPTEENKENDKDVTPPQDGDGNYICGRKCEDGSICKRTIRVAWMPCYDHFGQPVKTADEDE
ncbi:hypothetical protein SAMN04487948_10350 [Halogranum amylolyticum]|uniref:Uncharacterized protein n=1 Tax=Halogranum amylolyticum TaxID=660520 RepID=A0A1H8QEA9_9EURY|nr:hypothetical protein SAMN04487948_10350 [Halogranum amylolyticum]